MPIEDVRGYLQLPEHVRKQHYIRGIVCNRFATSDRDEAGLLIRTAYEKGAPLASIEDLAKTVDCWGDFRGALLDFVETGHGKEAGK